MSVIPEYNAPAPQISHEINKALGGTKFASDRLAQPHKRDWRKHESRMHSTDADVHKPLVLAQHGANSGVRELRSEQPTAEHLANNTAHTAAHMRTTHMVNATGRETPTFRPPAPSPLTLRT